MAAAKKYKKSCKFGRVTRGKRKGHCRLQKKARKSRR